MRNRAGLPLAVIGLLVGGGAAFLAAGRSFRTVTVSRPAPLPDLVVGLSGRTLEPSLTGLSVVLLAGVVAVPAARGRARQLVGALLAVCALALAWRSLSGLGAVSQDRARSLAQSARTGTTLGPDAAVSVTTHVVWPVLVALCAVLALGAALLTAARGHRWGGLGARYDAPAADPASPVQARTGAADPDEEDTARQKADLELWRRLDRGEDPTG